jgi:hypothetical protein
MPGGSREKGGADEGASSLDDVKTQKRSEAVGERRAATAKAEKASKPGGGDPAHDSPKRQGDKLAGATKAAAGRNKP